MSSPLKILLQWQNALTQNKLLKKESLEKLLENTNLTMEKKSLMVMDGT